MQEQKPQNVVVLCLAVDAAVHNFASEKQRATLNCFYRR